MTARVGRLNGWWYVSYGGRYHYGSLLMCLWCWWRAKRGKSLPPGMRPYGEHS